MERSVTVASEEEAEEVKRRWMEEYADVGQMDLFCDKVVNGFRIVMRLWKQ